MPGNVAQLHHLAVAHDLHLVDFAPGDDRPGVATGRAPDDHRAPFLHDHIAVSRLAPDLRRNQDVELVGHGDRSVALRLDLTVVVPGVLRLEVGDDEVGPLHPQPGVSPDHHGPGSEDPRALLPHEDHLAQLADLALQPHLPPGLDLVHLLAGQDDGLSGPRCLLQAPGLAP